LDESLNRLDVDCVDIYWLHRDELERPVGEIIETLAGFVKEGHIRRFGASNWTAPRLKAANVYAAAHGHPAFVAAQPGWALAERTPESLTDHTMVYMSEGLRQWHAACRFPCVAYSSQATGYFGEKNVRWAQEGFLGEPPRGRYYDSSSNRRRLLAAMSLAGEVGCTPNQIALAYLLNQPFPVFPIIGTASRAHLHEAMGALAIRLSPTQCEGLKLHGGNSL
jgi:aryl-alcohol dehydrogenase-like predicted oxidoreductase